MDVRRIEEAVRRRLQGGATLTTIGQGAPFIVSTIDDDGHRPTPSEEVGD
jgi:hypothetical protein